MAGCKSTGLRILTILGYSLSLRNKVKQSTSAAVTLFSSYPRLFTMVSPKE